MASDLVVVGVGVKPSVELAGEAGAEIGEHRRHPGGPANEDQFARRLGRRGLRGDGKPGQRKPAWIPLGDTANQMGRVAGTNAASPAGEDTLEFPGVLGTGIFKVFDLGVGKTGLSEEEAEDAGFKTVCAAIETIDRARYYPGAQKVFIKLISDRSTGRLIGAEAAGYGAGKLTDICATAIWGNLAYPDLVNLDLAYPHPSARPSALSSRPQPCSRASSSALAGASGHPNRSPSASQHATLCSSARASVAPPCWPFCASQRPVIRSRCSGYRAPCTVIS